METFDRQKTLEIPLVGDGKSFKISSLEKQIEAVVMGKQDFCAKSAQFEQQEGAQDIS